MDQLTVEHKHQNFHSTAHQALPRKKMPLQQLDFITSNKNKLAEVKAILGDVVRLQSQSLDLTEIQGTIEEISKDKCRRAASIVGL